MITHDALISIETRTDLEAVCTTCGAAIEWMQVQDVEHAIEWGLQSGVKGEVSHVGYWLPLNADGYPHHDTCRARFEGMMLLYWHCRAHAHGRLGARVLGMVVRKTL